jgi:replication factor C small subunit
MLDVPHYDPHSPKAVKDIVGNGDAWNQLAKQIGNNECPHIILCGPAGCGKSLFLKIMLESDRRFPLLKIDCTANSGLRDLRDSIRGFARGSRTVNNDFRWIVLEHADALTADTQAFLRRMMETTSNTTRIVFECRDAGAIAEPIFSRSSLFTVNAPDATEVFYELMRRTDFKLERGAVEDIVSMSSGNLRKALLHVLTRLWNLDIVQTEVNEYQAILTKRPESGTANEYAWIAWAIEAEQTCRLQGLDTRDLLGLGWEKNHHVSYMNSQWSRLGGVSPKALFFNCVRLLKDCPYTAAVGGGA